MVLRLSRTKSPMNAGLQLLKDGRRHVFCRCPHSLLFGFLSVVAFGAKDVSFLPDGTFPTQIRKFKQAIDQPVYSMSFSYTTY